MDKITQIAYDRLQKREYRKLRLEDKVDISDLVNNKEMPLCLKVSNRLLRMCRAEQPVLYKEDRIGFARSIKEVPSITSEEQIAEIRKTQNVFDAAQLGNISSDYEYTLNVGFDKRLEEINKGLKDENNTKEQNDELLSMKMSIEALYILTDKYQKKAEEIGNTVLADILKRIPRQAPKSYHEALVMLRIMNYTLWLNGNKHNTIGRFDQYMYSFFKHDIENKVISYEEAKDLTEELFIAFNFDADLYPGVQQGDNGQSLVVGGCKKDGSDAFNDLSKLVLEASLEVCLIDPKINMRVDKNTDDKWYRLGTELTKKGLGFPQYENDDIVIPGLVALGYDLEDARDYVVAACWEFIIPGVAMDIPNIDALNFPQILQKVCKSPLFLKISSYEELEKEFYKGIESEVKRMCDMTYDTFMIPHPFQSILMTDCVKNKVDIAFGAKYNNYGFHGVGISTCADSLAAIKKCVFDDKSISPETLVKALDANFVGYEDVRHLLLAAPKMGNNEDYVDNIAGKFMNKFALECSKYKNKYGGIYRAGTGTAMYYIWYSEHEGATPDGRLAGEPFAANYSPSLSHNFKGVLSVIQSFTKPDLTKVINGGPLTLEFHDTVFRNEEGKEKVAMLVKTFVALGGHQVQLNAINRDTLLDAQKHPEKYPNLIVRVWGWSGYFNELDVCYQNHIIKRLEFMG